MSACGDCPVRNHAICSALEDSELAILRRIGRVQDIPAGQTLMWEGDEASVVANVVEGVMKLSTSLGDGREQIVGVAYPADFIGRPFGERVPYTVTAITDVRVRSFQRAGFEKFAQEHPKLEHKTLERTLADTPGAEVMVFALDGGSADADVHARVFVPRLGIPEDPATGSACAALGGYLAVRTPRDDATLRWTVAQGVEMGRPSRLEVEVDKEAGEVRAVRVGGEVVPMMSDAFELAR